MSFIIIKLVITASLIVLITELAKESDKLGAFIASLPLVTLITLFWLYFEGQGNEKISNHAYYTFWYVIPTLPMFIFLPWAIKSFGFWLSFTFSVILTVLCFFLLALFLRKFNIHII
jgi:uncharacterized membrane protein (GlpM family)